MVTNSNSEANEYFHELIAWETEGERTPAQSEPSPDALDIFKPAFLRKQAA